MVLQCLCMQAGFVWRPWCLVRQGLSALTVCKVEVAAILTPAVNLALHYQLVNAQVKGLLEASVTAWRFGKQLSTGCIETVAGLSCFALMGCMAARVPCRQASTMLLLRIGSSTKALH